MTDLTELSMITFFLRQGVALVIGLSGLTMWQIAKALRSEKVKRTVFKYGSIVIAFYVGRQVAAVLDFWYGMGIGLTSNIVNYGFWIWMLVALQLLRYRIVKRGGQEKAADDLEEVVKEMRTASAELKLFINTAG